MCQFLLEELTAGVMSYTVGIEKLLQVNYLNFYQVFYSSKEDRCMLSYFLLIARY